MALAATAALEDAGLTRRSVDGLVSRHRSDVVGCAQPSERSARRIVQPIPSVLASDATPRCASMASADRQMICDATLVCGYATTMPHIMLATLFAEHFGVQPRYAHAVQAGGATGFALIMLAHLVVAGGAADHGLVAAGENRLSGQTRDLTLPTLAQAAHAREEVPRGATVPAYYGLVAARYMHEFSTTERDLAELAVLMRRHAGSHPGAQLRAALTVDDVLASPPGALPLKRMDCCPISDGAAAFIISREPLSAHSLRIIGTAQRHSHQHVSAAADLVSRHRSDVVGCAQPSERSARRIAQPIPSVLASDATPRCASMASADRQMIGD